MKHEGIECRKIVFDDILQILDVHAFVLLSETFACLLPWVDSHWWSIFILIYGCLTENISVFEKTSYGPFPLGK